MTVSAPSPHHSDRKGHAVALIVLHCDASPSEKSCLSWLQSPASKVSYHMLVGRDGTAYAIVPFDRMAWHAGKSEYEGRKHCNLYSIGLAFSNRNDGVEPLTNAQRLTMRRLIDEIRARYGPLPVTTHSAIAPGRKTDPDVAPGFALADYA